MHITKKIALLTGLLLPVVAAAAPFNPAPFAIDNKGDKVNIQHLGDEHFSFYQTTDGHLIGADSTGCYYYLGEDGISATTRRGKGKAVVPAVAPVETHASRKRALPAEGLG